MRKWFLTILAALLPVFLWAQVSPGQNGQIWGTQDGAAKWVTPTTQLFPPTTSVTPPIPVPSAVPIIRSVTVSSITQTSAIVSWSVDKLSSGQVEYGATASYGSKTALDTAFKYMAFSQSLSGLTPGVVYHYRVRSANAAGVYATSPPDAIFTTLPATSQPIVSVYLLDITTTNTAVQVTSTITPTGVLATSLFWSTSAGNATAPGTVGGSSSYGMVSTTGVYTPPVIPQVGVNVYKVWAVSKTNATIKDYCYVTILPNNSGTGVVGFGKNTTGGQGKTTVHVTNLNDSGSGSFRAVLGSDRTIVFDVGGMISLTSANIDVSGISNLTIDGTSAPGPGITFTQRGMWFRNSSNIVIKNIRHRGGYNAGPETGPNLTFFPNCTNVVVDHCSFSGFSDSAINLWSNIHEVTIVDCIVGPGIVTNHNFEVLVSEKCYNVTLLRNLMYGGDYRNPAVGWADNDSVGYPQAAPGLVADVVNNVIYKYGGYGTSIYWGAKANVINNWYWSDSGGTAFEVGDPQNLAQAYCNGNYHKGGATPSGNVGSAFSVPLAFQVTALSATTAADYVKANAGCRVGGLDATDTGIITSLTF